MQMHVRSCDYGFVEIRSTRYSMSFSASLQMCSVILGEIDTCFNDDSVLCDGEF